MVTDSAPMLPSAEHIKQQIPKQYSLPVEPWVAANMSRLWQDTKKHIQATATASATGQTIVSGTQVPPRNDQSTPASARSHS